MIEKYFNDLILNKEINRINIYGAGMYGVLLAANLANKKEIKKKGIQITLFDKADTILSTMKPKIINGYSINNGFYGIEMPRAEKTASILKNLVEEEIIFKKNYLRLININGKLIRCMSSINTWPEAIKEDIKKTFNLEKIKKTSAEELSLKAFEKVNDYRLGELIVKAFYRYNDIIEDTWTQFYPWFFPSEFSFPDVNDEGAIFYEKFKKNLLKPYIYAPKSFIFGDFIKPIQNSLEKKGIILNLKSEFSLNSINSQIKKKELNVWATSSFNLLNSASSSFTKSMLVSSRFHHLLLFKVPYSALDEVIIEFGSIPSEILCLDEISLGSSRISFPENQELLKKNSSQLILLEYYTLEREITNEQIASANDLLNKLFNFKVILISKVFGRKVYSVDDAKTIKACGIIKRLKKEMGLIVPTIFWGPINIAKCGLYAEEATNRIMNSLY